jgi:hypothetical protein
MSIYYKGPNYGENVNAIQDTAFCSDLIQNIDPVNNVQGTNFYTTYCTKAGKACMVAESGAAYHVDIAGGVSQLAMQQAWCVLGIAFQLLLISFALAHRWEDCMVNDALFDQFPRLKLWMHFGMSPSCHQIKEC